MTTRILSLLVAFTPTLSLAQLDLRYDRPARVWSGEALPLGNGRLGCMIFGGVERERIQFNEDSLWTGDENPSGDYASMGAYQNFGDLFIELAGTAQGASGVSCASEQRPFFASEDVGNTVDGNPETKWCLEHHGKPLVWQVRLPQAKAIKSYAFTACKDTPKRDPKSWELSASNDGSKWTILDTQKDQPIIPKRGGTRSYSFKNDTPYLFYRLTFTETNGEKHYQFAEITLADVAVTAAAAPAVEGYSRSLSLNEAIHRVTFKQGVVTHTRTAFASHPDQVIILRWTADKPGAISGRIGLKGAHNETSKVEGDTITFAGELPNGLAYEARLRVLAKGGKVETDHDALRLSDCDEATLFLAAGTSYAMDYARKWRGPHPHERLVQQIDSASKQSWDDLRQRHIADHQKLFNRVEVSWGQTPADRRNLTTDKRLEACKTGQFDPELETLLFQYGRYLLMGSSRRPGLPANLQGLWNDSNKPAWSCDYHSNINVQMNYWPAEPANLAECHLPFFDLVVAMVEPSRKATQASFGKVRGWTARTSHNIFGGHGWQWNIPASAWYALHFWEHYAFSGDTKYLREVAYPVMKEVCQYWEDHLKKLPDGKLVVPHGWSPEHGPREDGVAHDQQIVWDLFDNFVKASTALGVDEDYRKTIADLRDRLVGPKVGRWGQLQEWIADRDDPKDQHRHTSHLFAVYPGRQISVSQTPQWAKAAAISLEARGTSGDSRREWAWAWRCNLWARLQNGEKAHQMIQNLLTHNTLNNLFGNHPPMQLDGNYGITAGMCEMLLQSHADEIHLLPALPKAWPNGTFRGLRARGGFEVSATWKDGKVTEYRIVSDTPRKAKVRVNGEVKEITSETRK